MDSYTKRAIRDVGCDSKVEPSAREKLFFKIVSPIFIIVFYGGFGWVGQIIIDSAYPSK